MQIPPVSNKTKILMMAKEVRETKDSKEAALLLQTGDWIIISAAFKMGEIAWTLTKVN